MELKLKAALKMAEALGFIGEEDVEGALNWVHPFDGGDVEGDGGDVEGEGEAA